MPQPYSAQTQSLCLTSVGNARELGGYCTSDGRQVRRGLLLRSAVPTSANEADRARLRDDFHLTSVADFRMSMERSDMRALPDAEQYGAEHPLPRSLEFARTYHVPILNENNMPLDMGELIERLGHTPSHAEMIISLVDEELFNRRMYVDFLEDDCGKRGYAKFFAHLLEQPEDEALLFHCTQGKDRTGIAAMLLLSVLGVGEETILFDYLLTNEFNASLIAREREELLEAGVPEERLEEYMFGMDQVFPETMRTVMAHLEDEYGSVWDFVRKELGVSEAEREDLRGKYLEG